MIISALKYRTGAKNMIPGDNVVFSSMHAEIIPKLAAPKMILRGATMLVRERPRRSGVGLKRSTLPLFLVDVFCSPSPCCLSFLSLVLKCATRLGHEICRIPWKHLWLADPKNHRMENLFSGIIRSMTCNALHDWKSGKLIFSFLHFM